MDGIDIFGGIGDFVDNMTEDARSYTRIIDIVTNEEGREISNYLLVN